MTPRRTVRPTYPTCDDCDQRLAFVTMSDTGRRVPVDPFPVADGNVCARPIGSKLHGYVVTEKRKPIPGWRRYAAHFGTCPERARPGKTPRPKPEPPPTLPGLGEKGATTASVLWTVALGITFLAIGVLLGAAIGAPAP